MITDPKVIEAQGYDAGWNDLCPVEDNPHELGPLVRAWRRGYFAGQRDWEVREAELNGEIFRSKGGVTT